jgi:hypothetical protein
MSESPAGYCGKGLKPESRRLDEFFPRTGEPTLGLVRDALVSHANRRSLEGISMEAFP